MVDVVEGWDAMSSDHEEDDHSPDALGLELELYTIIKRRGLPDLYDFGTFAAFYDASGKVMLSCRYCDRSCLTDCCVHPREALGAMHHRHFSISMGCKAAYESHRALQVLGDTGFASRPITINWAGKALQRKGMSR